MRYQSSRGGQLKHAARSASWRQRRGSRRRAGAGGDIDKVTHQGCPDAPADASLLACDTPSARELTAVTESAHDSAPASTDAASLAALICRRCTHRLLPHVRQGFLRSIRVRWRGGHDHPT